MVFIAFGQLLNNQYQIVNADLIIFWFPADLMPNNWIFAEVLCSPQNDKKDHGINIAKLISEPFECIYPIFGWIF